MAPSVRPDSFPDWTCMQAGPAVRIESGKAMTSVLSSPLTAKHAMPTLEVIAGLHAGVSVSLNEPSYCLGSSDEVDLILRDTGVAPRHIVLRLGKNAVAIEAIGGDVFANEKRIPLGKGLRLPLPIELSLGEARIRLSAPLSRPPARRMGLPFNRAGVMALFGAVVLLGLYTLIGTSEAEDRLLSLASAPVSSAPVSNAHHDDAIQDDQVSQQLLSRLESAGLSSIHVEPQGRHIMLSGEIDKAQQPAWVDIQKWFDGEYGSRHVLVNSVALRKVPASPRVKFQAVWLGQDPYVVSESGTRLYPGAPLDDGWVLKQIEPQRIVLSRNGHEFSLTL
jgi:hypothetical protein